MTTPSRARDSDRGFTLVEVVIAIVLVGILSAVVVVGVGNLTTRGTTAACTTSADAARAATTTHLGTTGTYPTTFTQMTSATPPALTLPTGATIDANGTTATVGSWTLTLTPGTSGQPRASRAGPRPRPASRWARTAAGTASSTPRRAGPTRRRPQRRSVLTGGPGT